jgi:hypothetical protein
MSLIAGPESGLRRHCLVTDRPTSQWTYEGAAVVRERGGDSDTGNAAEAAGRFFPM